MKHLNNPGRATPRAVAANLVWGSPGTPTGEETIFAHIFAPVFARVFTRSGLALLRQFLRFAAVGFGGFLIDNACVYGLRATIGLYWAGLVAWVFAATGTWVLNRIWTFRGNGRGPIHRQYLSFLTANAFTFALNRGVYFTLITISPLCVQYPVLAIIAGTASGMFLNFHLFRTIVFR